MSAKHANATLDAVFVMMQAAVAGSRTVVGPGPSPPTITETETGGQIVRAGHKRFFFDLGSNAKGKFLRITEVRPRPGCLFCCPACSIQNIIHRIVTRTPFMLESCCIALRFMLVCCAELPLLVGSIQCCTLPHAPHQAVMQDVMHDVSRFCHT